VFADFVVKTIMTRHSQESAENRFDFADRKGIECQFSHRDIDFIYAGDAFGDCTAFRVRSQVDPDVANIHWTVYPWILDPYYRVIEVFADGKPTVKCHLLPLVIQGRPLLMLDAIEVVPKLRDKKDGSENPDLDSSMYERREELMDCLFTTCKNLARRMGLEVVYVDMFSNAKWVRDAIERLPTDSYHVRDVTKPYSTSIIENFVRKLLSKKKIGKVVEEVQAMNLKLMHQHMEAGVKEVGVLMGRRSEWRLEISGP
jgi:hypothetical protein